jgi:hypothetical protein
MLRRLSPGVYAALAVFALISGLLALRPLSEPAFAQEGLCRTFTETGKSVCGRFLRHWLDHGALDQYGYPISGEFAEVSELNGKTYTVLYFERAVFELHPENQPPYDVLLTQLGTLQYQRRYGPAAATHTPAAPDPANTPTQAPATPAPPAAPPPAPSPEVAPETVWIKINEYAERNGVTFVVFRADIIRNRIDVHYLIENETGAPIPVTLSNADQLVADNDYNYYPPLDPQGVRNIVLQPGTNFEGATSFVGSAYYNRAEFLTYGINNIPGLGNVRVRIPGPYTR